MAEMNRNLRETLLNYYTARPHHCGPCHMDFRDIEHHKRTVHPEAER